MSRERREVKVTKRRILHSWMRENEIVAPLHADVAIMMKRLSSVELAGGFGASSVSRASFESVCASENDLFLSAFTPTPLYELDQSAPLLGASRGSDGRRKTTTAILDMKRGPTSARRPRSSMFYALPLYRGGKRSGKRAKPYEESENLIRIEEEVKAVEAPQRDPC